MFSAYFDESGIHGESKALTVACVLSTDKKWLEFNGEWENCLRLLDLDSFHMTDYENNQGPYKTWGKDKKKEELSNMIEIIHKHVPVLISTSLNLDDSLYIESMLNEPSSPFELCFRSCLNQIEKWKIAKGFSEQTAIVYEKGSGYGNIIHKTYNEAKQAGSRFRSISFDNKKESNPLQAADILAYEGYKEMVNDKVCSESFRDMRKSAKKLIREEDKKYCLYISKETVDKYINSRKVAE